MANFEPAFDHIHLRSLDPATAAQFYVDHLGATISGRIETEKMLRVMIKIGTLNVFIDRVPDGTREAQVRPHLGLEHVGFHVNDIHAVAAELKAKGVEYTMDPTEFRPGLWISFIRGPDDVSIELLQRS